MIGKPHRDIMNFQHSAPVSADAAATSAVSPDVATGAEWHRVVEEFSGVGATFADAPSLATRFEQHAATRPDGIAISHDGVQVSYAELNRRANQVAHFLQASGVGPESLVGLFLERGIDLLVGLLGIVKSGGAYLPMDLAYPKDRLAFMTEDAGATIILSSATASATLDLGTARVIRLDTDWPTIAAHAASNPLRATTPDTLAYVIYTSGSTGRPKGCEVTDGNVVRLMESCREQFAFSADDAWTMFHSHAFDFSVWEIWGAWLFGGRVVVVPQHVSRTPDHFLDLLARERVTFLNQTPSAFKALTAAMAARPERVPLHLRCVVFGGETLETESLRPWVARYGLDAPQIVNGYGITETTVFVSFHRVTQADIDGGRGGVIGVPMPDLRVYVVNEAGLPCAIGVPGELYIAGPGVTRGYLRRPDLTAQRFVEWTPGNDVPSARMYRSGDLVRWLPEGRLEFLGRIDQQVKIRGFRIEMGEIEALLLRHAGVTSCAVVARNDRGPEPRLVAYIVPSGAPVSHAVLREHLKEALPEYMVPSAFVMLPALPMTANGKLDAKALPAPERARPELSTEYAAPIGHVETVICDAFAGMLQLDRIGRDDNFFELGGDSRLAVQAGEIIEKTLGRRVSAVALFTSASPAALADALADRDEAPADAAPALVAPVVEPARALEPIALIAMSARAPGADSVERFWENLLAERESVTVFTDDELDASIPAELRADPAYVRARTVLRDPAAFEPAFFGMSQRDAEIMDPQQRVLLELAWECLERAGYAPDRTAKDGHTVGVFAGVWSAEYLPKNVYAHPEVVERVGAFAAMLANDKDFVATRIAHRLNLTGPAIAVHTACSTGLVSIVHAFDSLRAGRCSMALAGGAAITVPPHSGYLYQDGAMLSRDGHTRTFDASSTGTVFGDGAAMVLMKRLSDAIADGDQIYAVIRGGAVNNDGGMKASFTAPSVDGQAAVVTAALADAGVDARSISYVEAHGTATPLGDPVEVEALTHAFRHGARGTRDTGYCRIGSAKSNVGHLVHAAGTVGVIKTALSLAHETLPATLHFTAPNPKIDFAASPFTVNATRSVWPRGSAPRRAGVSAFGVGGTNAHVVLEEAPVREAPAPTDGPQVLRLSARSSAALAAMAAELAEYLRASDGTLELADVAHTLQRGRTSFAHRLVAIAASVADAAAVLDRGDHPQRGQKRVPSRAPGVVMVFPGQGAQYAGMGSALYAAEPVFKAACDEVFAALRDVCDFDLKDRMFTSTAGALADTAVTQPATFCLEYALASLWLSRGIVPVAMIGHSIGEFVAAALAGVMSVRDAARLVATRGRLMSTLQGGSMLSVRASAADIAERMPETLSLAAVNGPTSCVVAGPTGTVAGFAAVLELDGILSRELHTSHAFHSAMMDPVVAPFESLVSAVVLSAPKRPIISTCTGTWLSDDEATNPAYWAQHLRAPVQFSAAVQTVLSGEPALFLEVGPRGALSTLIRQHASQWKDERVPTALASLEDAPARERAALALAVGQLWLHGIDAHVSADTGRRRVRLPTYPFERVRCWLDPRPATTVVAAVPATLSPPPSVVLNSTPAATPVAAVPTPDSPAVMFAPATARRHDTLVAKLRAVFEDVGGVDLDDADASLSFVELGLDSLILTQAATQIRKTFPVNVTFRQLMEQFRSLDALAAHLDAALPPEPAAHAAVAAAVAAAPVAARPTQLPEPTIARAFPLPGAVADGQAPSFAQQVIQQQLALMEQQLAILGGAAPAPVVMPPVAITPPAAVEAAPVTPVVSAVADPAPTTAAPSDEEAALAHTSYDVKKAFGAIARIHTRPTSDLTDRQRQRLDAFIRSYVARTKASKAYTEQHRSHLADPRVVNGFRPQTKEICYQIVINRSKGSHMWDLDGNEYVDALSGFGMNMFGWQPEFVNAAVKRQLDEGHDIGPQHPLAGEVAALICELTGFDRAGLCNTGSEAVMGAMRIARTVTGRNLIVSFAGSYHGIFDEALVRGTKKLRTVPAAPGILPSAVGNVLVLDYGTPESLEIIRSRASEIAAVLVEPVQSRRPEFQPVDFLRELRKITQENGTVLIFDEVITGFRAHPRGSQGVFGIQADLASYGKVVGGGYPVGVIAGKREFMDALDGGAWQFGDDSIPTVGVTYFAGTFVRHPLALAACKAVLEHLKAAGPQLQRALTDRTTAMAAEMNEFARRVGAPLEIRHFASLWRITFTEEHPLQDLLWAMMRNRGIHILDNFPCFLTTAHSEADIAAIVTAFRDALTEMQASGFLPKKVATEASGVVDASLPPVANARLGRDRDGTPAWFVPDPKVPGQYMKVTAGM